MIYDCPVSIGMVTLQLLTLSFHLKMNKHNTPLSVQILALCFAITSHFLKVTLMAKSRYPKGE